MARVLAISSQVVRGHVGLSAIVPALQRLGHEVLPIPTIVLSNHPGHARAAGTRIEVNTLMSMLDVLDANDWISTIDAVITGYLPSPEHVFFAQNAIDVVRTRRPDAVVLVDPVIGDDPKGVYVDPAAAAAIRDDLVPRASVISPNRFELSWLSGRDVGSPGEAVAAAATFGSCHVIGTSIPSGDGVLANVSAGGGAAFCCEVVRRSRVPHGTGDLLSGLFVGHLLRLRDPREALARAVGGVQTAITTSEGMSDMMLTVGPGQPDWAASDALEIRRLG